MSDHVFQNPGLYADTSWTFPVQLIDPETDEPLPLNGVYEAEVRRFSGDAEVMFTFREADGTVDHSRLDEGVIILQCTPAQRGEAFTARTYSGRIMRVDTPEKEFVAAFDLLPGVAAEQKTWFVIVAVKPAAEAVYRVPASIGPAGDDGDDGADGVQSWNELQDKPAEFPPAAHGHGTGDVAGLDTALAGLTAADVAETAARAAADDALRSQTGLLVGSIIHNNQVHSDHYIGPWNYSGYLSSQVGLTISFWRYKIPVYVAEGFVCTESIMSVRTAGGAGEAVRWGLRKWDRSQGLQGFGELVFDSGKIGVDTTGIKAAVIPGVQVDAGWYVYEVICNSSAARFAGMNYLGYFGTPSFGFFMLGDVPGNCHVFVSADGGATDALESGLPVAETASPPSRVNWSVGLVFVGMR